MVLISRKSRDRYVCLDCNTMIVIQTSRAARLILRRACHFTREFDLIVSPERIRVVSTGAPQRKVIGVFAA